jgi:hypothetical protein
MTETAQEAAVGENNRGDKSTGADSLAAAGGKPFRWLRRHRGMAALAAVVAAALGLVIWGQLAPKGDGIPLSVHNPEPEGARAVSEILSRHGVKVTDATSFEAAMTGLADSDSPTLLLYDRDGFLDDARLLELADAAGRVVVIAPRLQTLAMLDSGIRQAGVVPESSPVLEPGCSLPDAAAAGQVTGESGFVYDGGTSCYRPAGSTAGLLAVSGDGRLTVLGSTAVLSNEGLDELGNAALAVRTLGSSPDLVWYLPSVADMDTTGSPKHSTSSHRTGRASLGPGLRWWHWRPSCGGAGGMGRWSSSPCPWWSRQWKQRRDGPACIRMRTPSIRLGTTCALERWCGWPRNSASARRPPPMKLRRRRPGSWPAPPTTSSSSWKNIRAPRHGWWPGRGN